ncbi:flagellar motor protein MotB [Virgibacillus doumboii]|uniref:flagellar motor protein MotB n=1 Tax=Virgibacillus doumboii TaxID=2697503 RepID=UPI0013E0E2D5|nr:flagellar motor protein MotB [Virgibacillus doumboii]
MRRKKRYKKSHINESWLLPYSDMLTLIAALFIVLFAMSEIDAQKYQQLIQVFNSEFGVESSVVDNNSSTIEPAPSKTPIDPEVDDNKEDEEKGKKELLRLKALQEQINKYINENNLSDVLRTQLSGEGLMITISNDVSFDSGSDKVKKYGKKIAREMSEFLYTDPPHRIVVSGHTDNVPIHNSEFSSNWELSAMRAINFMRLLLDNEKLDPERFSSKGYGKHHPIVPNTGVENRAKNRRVEVLILPNYDIPLNDNN